MLYKKKCFFCLFEENDPMFKIVIEVGTNEGFGPISSVVKGSTFVYIFVKINVLCES